MSNMGDDWVSAKPAELLGYAQNAMDIDSELWGQGERLRQALEDFRRSNPDEKYLSSIPPLNKNVQELAVRARKTDDWVGRVGEAFRDASGRGIFGDTKVQTVRAGSIDLQLPGEEADLARDRAMHASRDAEALLKAVQNHDTQALANLRAKLATAAYDSTYAAAFFKALGPQATLSIAGSLKNDQATLKAFDEALGTATRSSDWDPSFTKNLLTQHMVPFYGQGGSAMASTGALRHLLHYGVFSRDFLTKTLDSTLMPDEQDPNRVVLRGEDLPSIEMRALARNPQAAAEYLGGRHGAGSRLDVLTMWWHMAPGWGTSLGSAIAAGGSAPDQDPKDPNLDLKQAKLNMLRAVGGLDPSDPLRVPEEARDGIASAVTANVGPLASASNGPSLGQGLGRLPWMRNLFTAAELHPDGTSDNARARQVVGAMNGYVATHLPAPDLDKIGSAEGAGTEKLGRFYELGILPVMRAYYPEAKNGDTTRNVAETTDTIIDGVGLVTSFIPLSVPASAAAGVTGSLAGAVTGDVIQERTRLDHSQAAGRGDVRVDAAEQSLRMMAASTAVVRNPDLLPGDPDDPNSLAHLARTNPRDPRVRQHIELISRRDDQLGGYQPTDGERALRAELDKLELGIERQHRRSHPDLNPPDDE